MVNVKFSPNQAQAKLRALLFQWELLFLWVPLQDCRKCGRRWEEGIQWGERKNQEDISQLWQWAVMQQILTSFPAESHATTALGMSSTSTFPQHLSLLSVPPTPTERSPEPIPLIMTITRRDLWSRHWRQNKLTHWLQWKLGENS